MPTGTAVPDPALTQNAAEWAHTALDWIGFGTLAGLTAKFVVPGRNPGGPIATLMMGIAGTCLGLGMLTYFNGGQRITPISPLGFVVAVVGAGVLLFFHRLLGGYFFVEQGEGYQSRYGIRGGASPYSYRRPARRRVPMVYEE